MGQLGMQPVPGAGEGGAIEPGVGDGLGVRGAPGVGLPEDELASMPGRATKDVRLAEWGSPAQDTVRTHPGQHLHGQVPQEEGQPRSVVAGVHDDEDVRVAWLPLPCGIRRWSRSRSCRAVTVAVSSPGASRSASSGAVHELRPGSSAQTMEYGQPGTGMCWSLPLP